MGKKSAQRTKGNVQASSSARAAQMLEHKGGAKCGVVGFKTGPSDATANLDPVLSASLRKLNKKEAVTKQKAFQELLDGISEENVLGCLNLWPRIFNKTSIDTDRKVRELSYQLNNKIAMLSGRNLAPHLNSILGVWLEGTCDSYQNTSILAYTTLTSRFSDEKLIEAIKFCQSGIVKHVKERLNSSPESLSDMKLTDPVDAEEKYSRVIGSVLRMLIRVLILMADNKIQSLSALMEDPIIWKLSRSKNLQVRQHVFKFISGVCTKLHGPGYGVPEYTAKVVTYNLNTCNHVTSPHQLAALHNLILLDPDYFWSKCNLNELRGQVLDILKSKALQAGVFVSIAEHLTFVVVEIFFKVSSAETNDGFDWLNQVYTSGIKCWGQSKLSSDKEAIPSVLFDVSKIILAKSESADVSSLYPIIIEMIGNLLHHLSRDQLSDQTAEQLYVILSLLSAPPLSLLTKLLSPIKSNDSEIQNTLIICRVLTSVLDSEQVEGLYEFLARRTHENFNKYQYVSIVLENYPPVNKYLYDILNSENSSDTIAHINLANAVFVPILSSCSEDVLSEVWTIILLILPCISADHQTAFVKILLQVGQHQSKSVVSLIEHCLSDKEKYTIALGVLPKDYITNYFYQVVSDDKHSLPYITELCARALSLFPELSCYYRNMLDVVIDKQSLTAQQVTIFSEIDWVTLCANVPDITDSIVKLPPILTASSANYSSIFTRLIPHLPTPTKDEFLDLCFKSYLQQVTAVSAEQIGKLAAENLAHYHLEHLCKSCDDDVSFAKEISILKYNHDLLLDMTERYDIFILPRDERPKPYSQDDISRIAATFTFYQTYLNHVQVLHSVTDFTQAMLDNLATMLYQLVSLEYSLQVVASHSINSGITFRLIVELEREELVYGVINQFIRNRDMIVIYFLKDLLAVNFDIQWLRVKGVYELGVDLLINLATNFKHQGFIDVIEKYSHENTNFSTPEKLLVLEFLNLRNNSYDALIEFINEECLEIEEPSAVLCGVLFRVFHALFISPLLQDNTLEFLLCSTATLFQNMLNAKLNIPFYEIYSVIKFKEFFLTLRRLLTGKTESSKYTSFCEDWSVFFEPGIQDLVLVYQDYLLDKFNDKETNVHVLRHIAEVSALTPVSSVQTYFKHVLNSNTITFNDCFNYILSKYNSSTLLSYKTQQALFTILVHAQNEFQFTNDKNDNNSCEDDADEHQVFCSPSQVFVKQLSVLDYNVNDEDQYRYNFIRAAQIWCLMLQNEAVKSPHVLREHVSYLRTRSTTTCFLNTLAKSLDFTVKKYSIKKVPELLSDPSYLERDMAATCLYYICDIYPALVRSWWKSLDKEYTMKVDKFISAFISPLLIAKETSIKAFKDDNCLQIKSRTSVREIIASYNMDDVSIDLTVFLAPNHPLVPPTVNGERQVGVAIGTWRSWLLQITAMFHNQNCSIVDGLEHWKKNMDKQFEGMESCMICFSVVQGPKKDLPKPKCRTCKKRFHSACLYKWFSTSNKATCPMCRSVFHHGPGLRERLQNAEL